MSTTSLRPLQPFITSVARREGAHDIRIGHEAQLNHDQDIILDQDVVDRLPLVASQLYTEFKKTGHRGILNTLKPEHRN